MIFVYINKSSDLHYMPLDTAYAVSMLNTFSLQPSKQHFAEAYRLLQYLYNTRYHGILYAERFTSGASYTFQAASDTGFADDVQSRKSTEAYVFKLFVGTIDWKSRRQATVTTSTTEAELLSLSSAAKEIYSWGRRFKELNFDPEEKPILWCDNVQTVRLIMNWKPVIQTRLKHIDIHQM